jgi:hypothetical protein
MSVKQTATGFTVSKVLTPNDTGATGSHQAGIHVPMALVKFFPPLQEESRNPDHWISVRSKGAVWSWRFIHYNKARFGEGTRDEYRLTHITGFMNASAAVAGQVLKLTAVAPAEYEAHVDAMAADDDDTVVLLTSGAWRVVRIGR